MLAGEKRRIGRGILAIALLLGGMAAFAAVLVGGAAAIDAQLGNTSPALGGTDYTPLYHAAALASVALVTPWSMLIQRWLYGVRGASLHSVVSRFRPDLLGRGLLLVGPFWVLAYVVQNLAVGPGALTEMSFATVIGLLAVTLLLAPLQAGAEEYGLRGLVFRVAGSWARGPQAGLILGIVVSSVVFAVIHGATDPWLNIYYLTFSVAVAVITWRTGGIEIAVVVHAVTNMFSFSFAIAVRQDLAGSLANRAPGDVAAAQVLPSMIALALVMAVVWLRTRRTGPARTPSEA